MELAIGVLASVIAAALVLCIQHVLLPRLRGHRYEVANLKGTRWKDMATDGTVLGELRIEQLGDQIKAYLELYANDGPVRTFEYVGNICGAQLVLTWKERDAAGLNVGSMVLVVSSDRAVLAGKSTYLKQRTNNVVSKTVQFLRMNEDT